MREDILLVFESICLRYVISRETSDSPQNLFGHVHFYFQTYEKFLLNEIRSFLFEHLLSEDIHFDIQACRSPKSVIKYISKEDLKLLYNVRTSELHFNYRVHDWCIKSEYFNYDHYFVTEHRNCYRYLLSYFNEHKIKKDFPGFPGVPNRIEFPDCVNDVIDWWNEFIITEGVRRRQLYLYGDSTLGKSQLIEDILGELYNFCYFPDVGKFFMNGFKPSVHKIILFEEFDIQFHCESMLKRLTEGRRYAYPTKGSESITIAYSGPVIFVSNNDPSSLSDPLKNRLTIVHANEDVNPSEMWWKKVKRQLSP